MPVLQVRLTDDEHAVLQALAMTQTTTMSGLIKQWISLGAPALRGSSIVPETLIPPTRRAARARQRDEAAAVAAQVAEDSPILQTPVNYTGNFGAPRAAPKPATKKR